MCEKQKHEQLACARMDAPKQIGRALCAQRTLNCSDDAEQSALLTEAVDLE